MKTSFSRRIALTMAMIFVFTLLPVASSAKAASCKMYNRLDEIEENLQIFKTISTGSISAEEANGSWYYVFSRRGADTVYIKASAFTKTPSNQYLSKDNRALSKAALTNYDRICYYTKMDKEKNPNYDQYTIDMYRFLLEVDGFTSDQIVLKASLTHFVSFTYCTKIPFIESGRTKNAFDLYIEPTNAYEYTLALKRSSIVNAVTPELDLTVINTGDNSCCLSSYTLCGLGNASKSINVNDYISVATSASESIIAAVTMNPSGLVSLISLIGNVKTSLLKESKQYNTGMVTPLTKRGKNPVLRVHYVSPIRLEKIGDWVQFTTYLHGSQFSSKKKAINASFEISYSFS